MLTNFIRLTPQMFEARTCTQTSDILKAMSDNYKKVAVYRPHRGRHWRQLGLKVVVPYLPSPSLSSPFPFPCPFPYLLFFHKSIENLGSAVIA